MAGVSDWPFRLLCFEQGCDAAYTEMVSAMGLKCAPLGNRVSAQLLETHPSEGPVYVQIFGKEPDIMAWAAAQLEKSGRYHGIDINMGCPAPKIAGSGEGSALMREPALAARIIEAVVKAVYLPVSVKMRLGWDESSVNVLELARIAQEAGVKSVIVHGRTRSQQYGGKADWDQIARVKQTLSIPVYGNGDVFDGGDALRLWKYSGCDGLLIGRGAMGNPWIFSQAKALLKGEEAVFPTVSERVHTALRHARMMAAWKGEGVAVKEMRKHLGWYAGGLKGASRLRAQANDVKTMTELEACLAQWHLLSGCVEELSF
jgi:nifR3 family TIM-barrel protein